MNRNECAEFIKKNIPDEGVRMFIFSDDDKDGDLFLSDRNLMLKYYSSIMNLAFAYIYGKFRKWDDSGLENEGSNNFKRLVGTLKRTFDAYDLTYELIETVLLDVRIDQELNGTLQRDLKLEGISLNSNLSRHLYRAKRYRKTSRLNEDMNVGEQREELIDFIRQFPFLRHIKIEEENNGHAYRNTVGGDPVKFEKLYDISLLYCDDFCGQTDDERDISTYRTLIRIGNEYFFLDRAEAINDDGGACVSLRLNYSSVGDFFKAVAIVVENEKTADNDGVLTIIDDGIVERYFLDLYPGYSVCNNTAIKDMHTVNYKYLKNLSLSVSDVLSSSGKSNLLRWYGNEFESVFVTNTEGGDRNDVENYNWDNIMGMLLIEDSASNILKKIFLNEPESFQRLLKNLEIRLGPDKIDSGIIRASIKKESERSIVKWEDIFIREGGRDPSATSTLVNVRKQNKSEIAARTVVMALSKASNDNEKLEVKYSFPIGMDGRIRFLDDLKRSRIDIEAKKETLSRVIKQTLRALFCFYKGFFKYAEQKLRFEDESYYMCLSGARVREYQNAAEDSFREAVEESIKELIGSDRDSIPGLMKLISELCVSCRNANGEQTLQGKLLKDVLGKNNILDVRRIQYLCNCIETVETEADMVYTIEQVIKIFRYLGGEGDRKGLNAIFPYVTTYEFTSKTSDGYNVENFTINTEYGLKEVKILSEFQYTIYDKYFCLPNISRSNESLWIEPILIKFINFDEKMAERVNG